MTEDLSKKVLDKIKKEEVKPVPKWEFLVKKSVLWGALGVSLLIGGMAIAVVIFMLETNDWDLHDRVGGGVVTFVLESLPIFWLAIFGMFVFIGFYNFRQVGHGYRYRFPMVVGIVFGISSLFGVLFFGTGLGQALENEVLNRVPAYQRMEHLRQLERWSQPQKGLLAGEVLEDVKEGQFVMTDFGGEEWVVIVADVPQFKLGVLDEGKRLKVFGVVVKENCLHLCFIAEDVRPWERNFVNDVKQRDVLRKKMKEELELMMGRPRNVELQPQLR